MSEYRQESQTLVLLSYFREHPGLVLSISYALLTLCGILYSASFYREFDLAILKLANVSDLLIAGLSEPAALLMFVGGLLVALSADYFTQFTHQVQARWREKPKSFKRTLMMMMVYTPKKSEHVMLMVIGIFILYAYVFVSLFAEWHSERIKQGYGNKIMVTSSVLGDEPQKLTLLGSTTNFLLTYNPEGDQVAVIPLDNVAKFIALSAASEE